MKQINTCCLVNFLKTFKPNKTIKDILLSPSPTLQASKCIYKQLVFGITSGIKYKEACDLEKERQDKEREVTIKKT